MTEQKRSADQVLSIFAKDPKLLEDLKANPLPTLAKSVEEAKKETEPAYFTDKWIYRMVVGALGLVLFVSAVGAIVLVTNNKATPDVLVALGSAAVGALAGMLVPSPMGK